MNPNADGLSPETHACPALYPPSNGQCWIDAPNSSKPWYDRDVKAFDTPKMRSRRTFIREAQNGEIDPHFDFPLFPATLWLQVIRIGAWHYRLPFWRGPQPFLTLPLSDDAVAAIVVERQLLGGCDAASLEQWQRNWLKYSSGRQP